MKFKFDLTSRHSYSYKEYRDMINKLLANNKTTGENHSEDMLGYSNMNVTRMKRLDKTAKLSEDMLSTLETVPPQKWIVLSEAWCGDAAQNLPWIVKMAEASENINLELILRDENLDIMDEYLTNGGRSIPKLIALDTNNEVLFQWGPRPKEVQSTYTELRDQSIPYGEISKTLHTWYAKNKGQEIQKEFLALLGNLQASS